MKKLKLVCVAIAMACATPTLAGGLLTNTNQHVAFVTIYISIHPLNHLYVKAIQEMLKIKNDWI